MRRAAAPSAPAALPEPPPELAELARLVGPEAALILVEIHGGTRLPVPKAPNQGTRLAREIGLDAARALSAEYGGLMVKVPLAKAWRARIYRARGDSYAKIARALGATEGRVWAWLNQAGQTGAGRQLDLF